VSATETAAAEKAVAEKALAERGRGKDVAHKLKAAAIPATRATMPLDYSKWDNLASDSDSSPRSLSPVPRRGEPVEEVQMAPKPEQVKKKQAKMEIPAARATKPLDYSKWDNLASDSDSSPRSLSPVPRRGEPVEEEVQMAPKPEQVKKKKAKKKKKKSGVYTDSGTSESALRSAVVEGDLAGLQRALDQIPYAPGGEIEWPM
jgi:hypothetical protein